MKNNKVWQLVQDIKKEDITEKELIANFSKELNSLNLSGEEVIQVINTSPNSKIPSIDAWRT